MSAISPIPSVVQCVVLNAANPSPGANTAIPFTAISDNGARWNSGTHRLTALANEVWSVQRGSYNDAAQLVSARKNGVALSPNEGYYVHGLLGSDVQYSVGFIGVFIPLAAGDYIDFAVGGAGAVGTFRLVLQRLA